MLRAAGSARQAAVGRQRTRARIQPVAGETSMRFPSFWRLQAVGWVSFYLLGLAGSVPEILRRPVAMRDHAVSLFFMFLASCGLRPVVRALLRRAASWPAFASRAAVWCMVWGALAAVAARVVESGLHGLEWAPLVGSSVQFAFVLFLWCSLYLSVKQWQRLAAERERLLRAETAARDARLSALRYQLNPHFLFNSLNAVSTLVLDGNAPAATQMLAQIGELLRSSLDADVLPEVELAQEMAFTEQYLAIEQTRLGERLQVDLSIPADTLDALVPSMLLQPLVENAVRHGVAPLVEGGRIAIESRLRDSRLRIVIRNSGRRAAVEQPNGSGIGLSNTAERLQTLYGADHSMALEWPPAGGCTVTVELPFRTAPPLEAALCGR
jgi:two-component system, LytTR family, sensor kinase